jgi:hypothetical protein
MQSRAAQLTDLGTADVENVARMKRLGLRRTSRAGPNYCGARGPVDLAPGTSPHAVRSWYLSAMAYGQEFIYSKRKRYGSHRRVGTEYG